MTAAEIKLADSEPKAAICPQDAHPTADARCASCPSVVFGGGQDSIGHIIVVNASPKLGAGALFFRSPEGAILDPNNLYHRVFLSVLAKAGIRKIRLHDLRHTFGSPLLQNGASIVFVKEEIGHSSIQVTVDTYRHLIPGANVCFVNRLDQVAPEPAETTRQQSAPPAQHGEMEIPPDLLQVVPGLD